MLLHIIAKDIKLSLYLIALYFLVMKLSITQSMTLLEALSILCPQSSKTTLRQFIREGRVLVDSALAKKGDIALQPGQEVVFEERKVKWTDDLKIVFEDPYLVVVDKPAGLLSVETNFEKSKTVHALLKERYRPKKVFVIHRLDQDTSGLMVFALQQEAFVKLKEDLKERHVRRIYQGIVEGRLEGKGTWSCNLYEDEAYFVHATDDPAIGEHAVTHYEALQQKRGMTLVRFQLETGKKNQIRVQAARAGHPIVGDSKYGSKKETFKRLALHAAELQFQHPHTKKTLTFCSNFPIAL